MQPSLERLRKIFGQERVRGFDNKSIIGGLAKMLDYWEGEARADGINEDVIQAVVQRLRSYEGLTPESRGDALKGLWKRISETYPEASQRPPNGGKPANRPVASPTVRLPRSASETAPTVPLSDDAVAPQPRRPEPQRSVPPPRSEAPRPRQPAPSRAEAAPGGKHSQTPAALNAPLTVLQGVGPKNASTLEGLGLRTLGDMLYYFPRRYEDYSQLKPIKSIWYGEQVTVIGTIQSVTSRPIRGGAMTIIEAIIGDGTGNLRLSWFNQPWMANRLREGQQISVSGTVDQYLGRLVMSKFEWEPVDIEHLHTNRIVPIYALTARITQKWLRERMKDVVTYWAPAVVDSLPEKVLKSSGLIPLGQALLHVHFPDSQARLKEARERLAFDEIFFLQMGVLRQKRDWKAVEARRFPVSDEWLNAQVARLPFQLTAAQTKAAADIRLDLDSGKPMNRLLQGDVGSGKTVVAALAAAMIVSNGAQAAIMAPTGILAGQHYRNFLDLLAGEGGVVQPEEVRLLVSDTPESEKEAIRSGLADGSIKTVIGTHALLEGPVQFKDLQLSVIDEQHRFGVEQRAELRSKGANPHLLVMTATPIPRSLALTIYGDLDLSVMDEMPVGRQPVDTHVLRPQERERAYTLVRGQIQAGRQAFIIYPLIEESEKMEELRAAVDDYEVLSKEIFPDLKLGLLHGRMKPDEKDETMLKFRDGEYNILVSTTVVEVGVDVPNATVMLIEGADRFGLAQLHQLRGRVGRGSEQSYCLLIPTHEDKAENDRLQAMAESNDGFVLAERDLQQRGPGEFLGTRQSGYGSALRMASLTDIKLIEKARSEAEQLFADDPDLTKPEDTLLAEALQRFWGEAQGDVS
ncbi:MAG TPA: ATP-dependent DNA helicase RecG [Anaerolineales bacterium]|nr:ATP-dependent DNA helicase RecG [Anaerolineales bacterium]